MITLTDFQILNQCHIPKTNPGHSILPFYLMCWIFLLVMIFFLIDNFCVLFLKTLVMVVNEQLSVLRTQSEVKPQPWNLEKMAIYPLNRIARKPRSSGILGKISTRILREPFQVAFCRPLELSMCMSRTRFAMLSISKLFGFCFVFCFQFSSGDLLLQLFKGI